ncbi:hypothetical protein [Streptomyces telluris]|uniref:Uncharacterized protein n=1 Tax=Streptomyces telluris TaxID=2720021 RepID=A0A9X2LC68_9ACTN|nr:hypothetical protein [Streptomyces telluris]MCQ8768326.1 hypothetical protein [Streptomyces telluris]NJP81295.1 hypothetical protein [Streptomyces telluris]
MYDHYGWNEHEAPQEQPAAPSMRAATSGQYSQEWWLGQLRDLHERLVAVESSQHGVDARAEQQNAKPRRGSAQHDITRLRETVGRLSDGVTVMASHVEHLEARLRQVETLLDRLRSAGVRDAIATGEAPSDMHRRHSQIKERYQRLVDQDLRNLARELCPADARQWDRIAGGMPAARARAVTETVHLLFAPAQQGAAATTEGVLSALAERGYATEGVEPRLRKAVDAANGVIRDMAAVELPATLQFDADVEALAEGDYQPYNRQDTGSPGFIVAPAYAVQGEAPEHHLKAFVFLVPDEAP